jgi:hypothetical protein
LPGWGKPWLFLMTCINCVSSQMKMLPKANGSLI